MGLPDFSQPHPHDLVLGVIGGSSPHEEVLPDDPAALGQRWSRDM